MSIRLYFDHEHEIVVQENWRDREIEAKTIQIDSQQLACIRYQLMKDVEIEIGMEIATDS